MTEPAVPAGPVPDSDTEDDRDVDRSADRDGASVADWVRRHVESSPPWSTRRWHRVATLGTTRHRSRQHRTAPTAETCPRPDIT